MQPPSEDFHVDTLVIFGAKHDSGLPRSKTKKAAQCAAFKGGEPTRTRTVDQRIMSHRMTL
ncbi:hypothetical protein ALQ85_200088 [Pseudomonas syringae]|nr:hypothetical protein ALQ85_200088 [Pseudomonas syringae]